MSKKKILTIAISVALVAILVVGGSIAYFTDNKSAENVFTVGGVKIELIEQQRALDDEGNLTTTLEDFEQEKLLMPIVGSAQGDKDALGMPTADNYVDKIVTIENTGKSPAWIRAYFAIPSALDDGYETFNAGLNVLHFNFGNKVENNSVTTTYGNEWIWVANNKWNYYEVTIDGISYNVYYADYATAVPAGEKTEQFVQGIYLDKSFDMKTETVPAQEGSTAATTVDKYYAFNQEIDLSGLIDDEGNLVVKCPVAVVAVQASGFDDAASAVDAAFGEKFDPFNGTGATNWQQY